MTMLGDSTQTVMVLLESNCPRWPRQARAEWQHGNAVVFDKRLYQVYHHTQGAKTLIIMTVSIMTFSIMTFSIMTFSTMTLIIMPLIIMPLSIMTFSMKNLLIKGLFMTFSINDTQNNNTAIIIRVTFNSF
jgi:hypothetical protein